MCVPGHEIRDARGRVIARCRGLHAPPAPRPTTDEREPVAAPGEQEPQDAALVGGSDAR